MNYEDLLDAIGGFGRYQMIMLFLLTFFTFQWGLEYQNLVVSLYSQPFECSSQSNETSHDQCHIFNQSYAAKPCEHWQYSRDVMQETFIMEYNLVCDNKFWVKMVYNMHGIGRCIAAMFGFLPDLIGRRKIIMICVALRIIYMFTVPFITSFTMQLLVRLLDGTTTLLMHICLVLLIEIVPLRHRGWVGSNYYTPNAFGYMFSALICFYGQRWRRVFFISAFTSILNIPLYFLYPESPRWLLVTGRFKEARKLIKKIAWINGVKMDEKLLEDLQAEDNIRKEPFYLLISRRTIGIRTLVIVFSFWSFWMVYYGIANDLHFASKNIFITITLMGLMEIPPGPLSAVIIERYGRRISLMMCLAGTITCLMVIPFLSLDGYQAIIRSLVALLAKLAHTTTFTVTDVYFPELFPTSLRTSAMCFLSFFSAVPIIIAPYIETLNEQFSAASYLIYSSILLISMIAGFILFPETLNLPLPDVVDDANRLYKGNESEWKRYMLESSSVGVDAESRN